MKGIKNGTRRVTALMLSVMFAFTCAAGGVGAVEAKASEEAATDTITLLVPPVETDYFDNMDGWVEEYEAEHPNITIEVTEASWEDFDDKLNVMVNAGSPPDITFVNYKDIAGYVDLGVCVSMQDYLDEEQISDFDDGVLDYFRIGDELYGLPVYASVHSIGGNREMLEAAGIDWESVQQNGWSYDEFREAIQKGTIKDGDETTTWGFVFACSGVTAEDFFEIFVRSAGFPCEFDEDLKYTYTSSKMLTFLQGIRNLIDDGSMPDYLTSIDAGKRWNMFLTGQTMITGKGITSFEKSARDNNALLESGGDAVEGSIEVDYIVLPTPVFDGEEQYIKANVEGYICLTGEKDPDTQHLENVADFLYYLSSGEREAKQVSYSMPICSSGMEAYEQLPADEERNQSNVLAVEYLTGHMVPARTDISSELNAKATKIYDEVIIPKFQAMLSDEVTPEEVLEAIREAAYEEFGEDGCVTD